MRKSTRLLAFFCAFTLLFSYSFIPKANNDTSVIAEYGTAVPSLFRQNNVYSNEERTPLVVKDGVEYVPISVFSLYSYVNVEYSKTDGNFFLVNTKNNHYISFNAEQELASTYDGDLLTMTVQIFNQTRYVPARTVAIVLGFNCETYEDRENGIYSLRISDGKSNRTFTQIIMSYIDENRKNKDENLPSNSQNGDQTELTFPVVPPNVSDENDTQGKEDIEDPLSKIPQRRIGLCFSGISHEQTERIVNTLDYNNVRASFVLNKQDILSTPKLVRRLYSMGQGLLVTGVAEGETAQEYANSFVLSVEEARMCILPDNIPEEIKTDKTFLETIRTAGYLIFTPNFDAGDRPDYTGSAYGISERLKKHISNGLDKGREGVVTSLLLCSNKTYYYLLDIVAFVKRYNQMNFFALDESFLYNN